MALSDIFRDNGLSEAANITTIHICTADTTNLAEVAATTLANGDVTPGAIRDNLQPEGGREAPIPGISNGVITAAGTGTHMSLVSSTTWYGSVQLPSPVVLVLGSALILTETAVVSPD